MTHDNINRIRQLLTLYYDGTATPAQAEELSRLFATHSQLPDDMLMERRMFEAMACIANSEPVPSDLPCRIEQAISAECSKSRRLLWIRATAIAAAIAVISTISLHMLNQAEMHAPTVDVPDNIIAVTRTPDATPATVETKNITTTVEREPVKPRRKTAHRQHKAQPAADYAENRIIVVTDSAEATSYAEQSLQLLALNLAHAETACESTDQTIYEINRTLTEILK